MDKDEYIEDYKGYAIFQDMENGYFIAYNKSGKRVAYEATLKFLKRVTEERLK